MIRMTRIEVYKFCNGDKVRRRAWRQLASRVQMMTNRMWQIWLVWHINNGSADKLRVHFEAFNKWKESNVGKKKKVGKKPEWPVKAIPNELFSSKFPESVYRIISHEFPDIACRTRVLAEKRWRDTLNKRKSSSGSLPGWVAILFSCEAQPSFTHPLPIPFDKCSGSGFRKDKEKNYWLDVRVERLGDRENFDDSLQLMLNRRNARYTRGIVDKVISGDYDFKGSMLKLDDRNGKWFVLLSYTSPPVSHIVDPSKKIHLVPGKNSPWVAFTTKSGLRDAWRFGGSGRHVTYFRSQLQANRWGRQEQYRWAGSVQKGRGSRRAKAIWTKLSSRWRHFTKKYNEIVATRVVEVAVSRGIGTVVYHQPKESQRDKCFLFKSGRDKKSPMTWDWFQMKSLLASRCEACGVNFETAVTKQSEEEEEEAEEREAEAVV